MDRARRAQPSANPIITRQWTMHCMEMHKKKLARVKASIDNRPPKPMKHLRRNLKREQMREERYSAIERENRILLQKMAKILRTNKTLDTINQYKARSLNRAARRRELIRITEENQGILRRIQASEPTYNHVEWEEDRKLMEKRIDNISLYDRSGREKVLRHIESRKRIQAADESRSRRMRPQSAPIRRGEPRSQRRSSGRRARPASAMRRRGSRSSRSSRGSGASDYSDRSYANETKVYDPVIGSGGGRPMSAMESRETTYRRPAAHRPVSASRHRVAGSRARPTSAARTRPGYRGASGTRTSLEDLDLVPGAVLEADDEDGAYEPVLDGMSQDEHDY